MKLTVPRTELGNSTSTRNRWRRTTIYAVLLAGSLAAGFSLFLNSSAFQNTIRKRVIAELQRITGGQVTIQSSTFRLLSASYEARGITIRGLESPAQSSLIHIDRFMAAAKIGSLLRGQLAMHSLLIEHPEVHLILYQDGNTDRKS